MARKKRLSALDKEFTWLGTGRRSCKAAEVRSKFSPCFPFTCQGRETGEGELQLDNRVLLPNFEYPMLFVVPLYRYLKLMSKTPRKDVLKGGLAQWSFTGCKVHNAMYGMRMIRGSITVAKACEGRCNVRRHRANYALYKLGFGMCLFWLQSCLTKRMFLCTVTVYLHDPVAFKG